MATSVHLICAQRLVRRVCKDCAEVVDVPQQALIDEGYSPEEAKTVKIQKGKGCGICNNTGYKGRAAVCTKSWKWMTKSRNWFWWALPRSSLKKKGD